MKKIKWDNSEVEARLLGEGLVRYVCEGKRIVFFDRKRRRVVRIPRNAENKFFKDFGRGAGIPKERVTMLK